jgi:hypothetical protein
MMRDALKQAEELGRSESPVLREAAATLRKVHTHNQMLLDTGDYTPCDHCNQAIRVDHGDDELWEGFEEQAAELEEAIGNGPVEWTCSEECMKARIEHHS